MSVELVSLDVLTLFFLFAWFPASWAKRQTYGREWLLTNRDATALPPLPPWGDRVNRAYENLKGYFPAFVVAILVLTYLGKSDLSIRIAAVAFTASRLLHYLSYALGYPKARAWMWIIGLLSNTYLLIRILG